MTFPEGIIRRTAMLFDSKGNPIDTLSDPIDGVTRLQIQGKVALVPQPPPVAAVEFILEAATPLAVNQSISPHLTKTVIPDLKTLSITQVLVGCQGDPSADGSKVEIIFWDGATEFLLDRIYVTGSTSVSYPNTSTTRNGTPMTGDGTAELRVYRYRMSNSLQEIDAVVRGFTQ